MLYEDLIKHFGSAKAIADALGVEYKKTPSRVTNWASAGIPHFAQIALEEITKGALRADADYQRRHSDEAVATAETTMHDRQRNAMCVNAPDKSNSAPGAADSSAPVIEITPDSVAPGALPLADACES